MTPEEQTRLDQSRRRDLEFQILSAAMDMAKWASAGAADTSALALLITREVLALRDRVIPPEGNHA